MAQLTVTIVSNSKAQHTNHGPVIVNLDLGRGAFWTTLPDLGLERFPRELVLTDESGGHLFRDPMYFHDEHDVATAAYYRTTNGPIAWRLAIYLNQTGE